MQRPVLTVIAGPNGSGKSTLIEYLMRQGVDFGTYINADDIAREQKLVGDTGSLKAQKLADEMRDECLHSGKSFSFETVMSHESKVQFMQKAKGAGFTTQLYFVATGDPNVNVGRVKTRVALGGHDVPEDRIVARYRRTIALLPRAMLTSDRAVVFDNSIASGADDTMRLRPVLESSTFEDLLKITPLPPVPLWTIRALKFAELGIAAKHISNVSGVLELMLRRFGNFDNHQIHKIDSAFQHSFRQVIELHQRDKSVDMDISWDPTRQQH